MPEQTFSKQHTGCKKMTQKNRPGSAGAVFVLL
jgi:hypothetical protein